MATVFVVSYLGLLLFLNLVLLLVGGELLFVSKDGLAPRLRARVLMVTVAKP